ncbi:MAG: transposase [Chloroflexi bacterium]|nr:transposase [Chloroflexota bacterium]
MSRQRFSSGSRFRWRGVTYAVMRLLPDGKINIEDIFTGAALVVEVPTLVQALFDGELQFLVEGKHVISDVGDGSGVTSEYLDLSDYPEKLVAIARYRLEVIRPLLEMEKRTREAVKARMREIQATRPESSEGTLQSSISVASIYRWIRDYTQSGNDLRALIPATHKRGGTGESRLRTEVEILLEAAIRDKYYVREKVTVGDVWVELAARLAEENRFRPQHDQFALPSKTTLARRIEGLNAEERLTAKRGKRAAKRTLSQYGQTAYPTLPLERVEIDHTKSDLIVIDDRDNLPLGRLTLTYCLDMATRYPLGYYMGFEPPGYLAVMECLHHAIRPKENVREKYGTEHDWVAYGIPATLVIDNGKEFIGRDLQDACLLLGIVLQQTPVQTPHFKAGVERMYGSLNTMLFHTLPGTTFSNTQERGDYNSVQQACIYLSDVDKMLNILIVDIYAKRFHRGLNGIPARRWEELTQRGFAPGLPPNAEELSILLGRTTQRVVHHYGIEFASLRYNCDELVPLRTRLKREKAKIKYHPADLSYLHVYDPFENRYIRVPALDQEYTQELSLWKHRIIRQTVLSEQDRVDIVALGRAKRKIQEIVEEGRQRKRLQTRSRIARWDTSGKPTRQVAEEVQAREVVNQISGPVTEDETLTSLSSDQTEDQVSLVPEGTPDTDWEISYRPLKHRDDLPEVDTEQVKDG